MISLDWDEIDQSTAEIRCEDILKWQFVQYIDLFSSPMGTGFHVYVYMNGYDPSKAVCHNLRKHWHDDPKRMKNDKLLREGEQSVLFHYKFIDGKVYQQQFVKRFTK
jgi:hypothetical protein